MLAAGIISAVWVVLVVAVPAVAGAAPALAWAEPVPSCVEAILRDFGASRGSSFYYLIRAQQQRRRDRQAERFGGFEVDDQPNRSRRLLCHRLSRGVHVWRNVKGPSVTLNTNEAPLPLRLAMVEGWGEAFGPCERHLLSHYIVRTTRNSALPLIIRA